MRRLVTIVILVGLLVGMIMAVTACPKSSEPGAGGTVTSTPKMQPMQPSETNVPAGTPASPEGGAATPPAGEGTTPPTEPAKPGEGGETPTPPPAPPAPGEGGK